MVVWLQRQEMLVFSRKNTKRNGLPSRCGKRTEQLNSDFLEFPLTIFRLKLSVQQQEARKTRIWRSYGELQYKPIHN